ncbi:DUF4169 family protein [Parasedimentitalea maritima]|uniref:DUF4169 family protein n=1 Tax=Parasedimentitalea maritima TaxID=2578117 RepID=A0ABY2UX36_9RHOB|nr:DUF4169 family protein [Zongyanglinia marina]TLP64412.1 DUF4169 family protein [Zongyanglinia marina]
MAEPVNLNRFKKQKARAEKKVRADQNAIKHGRSKQEKLLDDTTANKARRKLDGHKIEE